MRREARASWSEDLNSDNRSILAAALRRILLPLTRLCIRHDVTYSDLMELTRMAYVEAAQKHFRLPDTEMTNARIAVLTGMSRRHVKHVKELLEKQDEVLTPGQNRAQRVVHGWLNDAEFLDKNNFPLVLPVKNDSAGKEVGSFVALVKRYSGDVSYGAVLDELNHARVTEQPDENTVSLITHAYVPYKSNSEQIRIIGKSVSDLFHAALHNIESDEKRLQRQVVYSHISADLVDECQQMIDENAKELIDKLNARLAQAKKESEASGNKDLKRVGFGVYYIEDHMDISKTDDH